MIKVALAAFIFSTCALLRAYVLLRDLAQPNALKLSSASLLGLGVVIPELLPIFAALLVLRRRPIACLCWREDGGCVGCGRRVYSMLATSCCCSCSGGDDRGGFKIGSDDSGGDTRTIVGIDRTPLIRAADVC